MATTSLVHELHRRGPGRPPKSGEPLTFLSDFCGHFFPLLHAAAGVQFPSAHYRSDPVAFSREILGEDPWAKQIEILEAVRDHKRVAVKSGHKVGKSRSAATLALWFYCSFPASRVVMTSTTARQVDEILWRELRMLRAKAGKCLACRQAEELDPTLRIPRPCPHSALIREEPNETARAGLKSDDFREVVGFTARQAEAVAGISGAHVLYIVDEASGVADLIFEAIEGNRAGNAFVCLFSNPTQNSGEFYDAFNSKARFYKTITVSSLDSPNVAAGRVVIPGLATKEWCDEKREEWGPKSPLYKVRVEGDFAEFEAGKIFSLHAIAQAEARWADTPSEGRLYIGLDPAGEKGQGDDIVFVLRRGLRVLAIITRQGLDDEGHLNQLLLLIKTYKLIRETPVVVLDVEGSVGAKVSAKLRAYVENNPGTFELVRVRASDASARQPEVYDRMRDALAASLSAWFDSGGSIPEDTKLEKELHSLEWKQRADGRIKVTDKVTLRKILGRSPDRYDGLALAVWEPLSLRELDANAPPPAIVPARDDYYGDRGSMDPYAGAAVWERR